MENKKIRKVVYSPMMEAYLDVKEQYSDALLFYRVGDFYEMFFEDAKIASKELDLILTGKAAGVEEKIPMCGVPHHAVFGYIQRLAQRGFKVAIAEQLSDPKEGKGLVERDVIKVVTPGTIISESENNKDSIYLSAIQDFGYGFALAFVEMSTGENFIETIGHTETLLLQAILRNNVKEVVVTKNFNLKIIQTLRELQIVISYCEDVVIKPIYAELVEEIKKEYELVAYGRMLNYLEATQKSILGHLQIATIEKEDEVLYMDFNTQQNLELISPLRMQSKGETLWTFLDVCKSSMGSRLLKKWIEKPLYCKKEIEIRHQRLEYLMIHFLERSKMSDHLNRIYDLQRLIARCAMNTAGAVDCQRLGKTLLEVPEIFSCIQNEAFLQYQNIDLLTDLCMYLKSAIVDNPPATISEGGIFRVGYNAELDEVRSIQNNGRKFIIELENKERARTGIKTLKIGYNKVFGYYVEISKAASLQVKEEWGYIRKQTLTNNERFIFQELKEKEDMILHAEEKAIRIEKQLFAEMMLRIKKDMVKLQRLSAALAELDCYCALAEISSKYGYVKPYFTDDEFYIEQGRHPILDAISKDIKYVANDIKMDKEETILLITGPNMGGKSTYMRQTALIVIMAQIGCYVPAKVCRMPLFDKIFTRIGASDDILSGQSTFMVEMTEANRALQDASEHSLIIFDEIGRGTSTYDGMALAQSMIEYIAVCIRAKTLFSTHYHELIAIQDTVKTVRNIHVEVKEEDDHVTFLYKIKLGSADRSYGINVARLAGLPSSVLTRAKEIQKELESKKRVVQQSYQIVEMKKEDIVAKQLKNILQELQMDDISPREAWQILEDLADKVKRNEDY